MKLLRCASAICLIATMGSVNAGYIFPATESGAECTATAAFSSSDDCVGQVTAPNNEANGNPETLLKYLNGFDDGTNEWYISEKPDGEDPWGVQGDWLSVGDQIEASGNDITGSSGFLSVTQDLVDDQPSLRSGDWTFDVTSMDDAFIDYLVVTVRGGAGWSAYYYDLTEDDFKVFTDSWDTLGITTGNLTGTPDVSHMFAAYILGEREDQQGGPGEIPVPGTLLLLSAPLLALSAWRRRRT